MDGGLLLFLLLVVPSLGFLLAVVGFGMVKTVSGADQLAEDAGWKRLSWGVYLRGPLGDPYQDPQPDYGRIASALRTVIVIVLIMETVLLVTAVWAAHGLGLGIAGSGLVGIAILIIYAAFTWITFGRALRHARSQERENRT